MFNVLILKFLNVVAKGGPVFGFVVSEGKCMAAVFFIKGVVPADCCLVLH